MRARTAGRLLLGWLPMVAIAVLNGGFREAYLTPALGSFRAHQVSTITGIVLFGAYIWWLMRRWRPANGREAAIIGAVWLVLTVLFEFGMGRVLLHREWSVLLADYNLLTGHLWPLILVWVAVAPILLRPRASSQA